MAYSAADVAAADRTLAAADKPMLGALAVYSATAAEWRTGGSFAAGADATLAGYPASRAYDGLSSVETKPNAAAVTWYYMLNTSVTTATFDGAMVIGHNFGTIGGLTITLQIADNNAFTTNLISIATWTPGSSNARLVDLVLESGGGTAQRYSTVPYIRLKIDGTSGTPQFTELVLFKRTQLPYRPNRPYNPTLTAQRAAQTRTDAGETTAYVSSRGARRVAADCVIDTAARVTEVNTWWTDTRHGTRSFVWVEYPNSAPNTTTYLVSIDSDNPEMPFEESGTANYRELHIDAVEQAPNQQALE